MLVLTSKSNESNGISFPGLLSSSSDGSVNVGNHSRKIMLNKTWHSLFQVIQGFLLVYYLLSFATSKVRIL